MTTFKTDEIYALASNDLLHSLSSLVLLQLIDNKNFQNAGPEKESLRRAAAVSPCSSESIDSLYKGSYKGE